MHILILPSWYPTSYNKLSGIFFKEQAEALVKHGYKVGVISLQDVGIRNIIIQKKINLFYKCYIENGVVTYRKQYLAFPRVLKLQELRRKIRKYIFIKLIKQYIQKEGIPDIIHLHSFVVGDFALYAKNKFNIPFVVTEHLSGFSRNLISNIDLIRANKVFEESSCNIAVSRQLRDLLFDRYSLDFIYIPNIVNIDFFRIKEYVEKETYNFINIALLDKNKNQGMLIKAFALSFRYSRKIRLTIVGSGIEHANLKKMIKDVGMKDQISLFGEASRKEVKELLQKNDAFVLSSKYETFGIVLIEALASGIPVIATKCGGPESIINSDKIGLLCKINIEALSEALINMYKNRNNYDSAFIREYAEENFSEYAVCKKLQNVYENVLK